MVTKIPKNNSRTIDEVRVGYYFDYMSINDIDPAEIKTFEPAQILNNIYSRLIEYDGQGNLQAGLASKFYFEGDFLILEFNKKAKTNSGHFIEAEDAAISIKRLLKLKSGTHSNIEFILDLKQTDKDIYQNWDEIFAKDQKLFIQVKKLSHRPYLISSLATGDLAIIPKSAIDTKTLKIITHKETSGPYYIEEVKTDKNLEEWVLKTNPWHYNHLESTPRVVRLIDKKIPTAFKLLIDNEIDIIPSSIGIYQNNYDEIKPIANDLKINHTLDINLTYAHFKASGLKLSREEKSYISNKFLNMFNKHTNRYLSAPTSTFFQDQAFGQLTVDEIAKITKDNSNQIRPSKMAKISFQYNLFFQNKFGKVIQDEISELELIKPDQNAASDKIIQLEVTNTDTAFEESLPLIFYNFKMGVFKSHQQPEKWIEEYMELSSQEEKAQKIHDLHLKALQDGVIFPIFKAPYTSIGRNGFSLPLSPIMASSHFWKITRD